MSYKALKLKKKMAQLRRPKKMFREGSMTGKLAFLLISKGAEGHLTDAEIRKEICGDLIIIPNRYERAIKISMRIRALIRDIRFKFGVWIGHVWSVKQEAFVWKVLASKDEFNQMIAHIQKTIDSLENVKSDLKESRDSEEYQKKVRKFYDIEQL